MTARGLIKTFIALVIIGAGVAIGWAVATSTNPYAPGAETATPLVAAQANNNAVRPTAIPTFTAASGVTGTNTTPGAGTGAAGTGGATGGGQGRTVPVTGTVSTFDATSKLLTVKDASGKSQEFDAATARITKTQKLTSDDFSKSLGTNGIVLLTGEKGSDGTYSAVSLVEVDATGFGGGTGTGGTGTRGAGANGGTPGAGASGTPGARAGGNFGGGNAAGAGGFGGAGGAVIVRSGTLQGNKFTGTSAIGEAITATISDTTLLEKQAAGTLDDLKPGANVSVTSRAAAATGPATAVAISLT